MTYTVPNWRTGTNIGTTEKTKEPDITIKDKPAFPTINPPYNAELGMTLRQHYAGQAMQAWFLDKGEKHDHKLAARFCVDFADAVIAALGESE